MKLTNRKIRGRKREGRDGERNRERCKKRRREGGRKNKVHFMGKTLCQAHFYSYKKEEGEDKEEKHSNNNVEEKLFGRTENEWRRSRNRDRVRLLREKERGEGGREQTSIFGKY